jgi:mono/diheme cytochrome c family protein
MARAVWLSVALALGGCGLFRPPPFRLNTEGRDADSISLSQKQAVVETLAELFGTADAPLVSDEIDLDLELLRTAAGPIASDEEGRQQGLYRQHCAACHGITGGGAGPAAKMLNPYPRDFRWGIFKYTSTRAGMKPTADDLRRTLRRGIPATAMPSFRRLPQHEQEALIQYVKYLSIRGETERCLCQLVFDENEPLPLGVMAKEVVLEDGALAAADLWTLPEEHRDAFVVNPPPAPKTDSPELLGRSIGLGRELYGDRDAQCVKCHGPEGAGDGEEKELYDDWNEPKKGISAEQRKELAHLFTLPIQRLKARDFREGIFRGGGNPDDLYLRIHVGIKGTPMPAAGPAPGAEGAYTEEEIWHVVNYVLSLSGTIAP